jgi:hypothetical protein
MILYELGFERVLSIFFLIWAIITYLINTNLQCELWFDRLHVNFCNITYSYANLSFRIIDGQVLFNLRNIVLIIWLTFDEAFRHNCLYMLNIINKILNTGTKLFSCYDLHVKHTVNYKKNDMLIFNKNYQMQNLCMVLHP